VDDATREAVKALWLHTHKPTVEINITDEFIAELKHQPNPVCVAPTVPNKQPQVTHPAPHPRNNNEGGNHGTHNRNTEVRPVQRQPSVPSAPHAPSGPSHSSPVGVGF
jgi:hypothetical protein